MKKTISDDCNSKTGVLQTHFETNCIDDNILDL